MTDNKSYREKGRALFLAAMMVLSVVAGAAVLTGSAAAVTAEDSPNADETYDVTNTTLDFDQETIFVGQEVTLENLNESREFVEVVERSSGDTVVTERASNSNVTIDFADIEEGYYYFNGSEGSIGEGDGIFEVAEQDLNADFTPGTVEDGNDATLSIESENRNDAFDVAVTADGLAGDELENAINTSSVHVDEDDDNVLIVEDAEGGHAFSDLDLGNYSVNVEVTDSTASDSASVNVVSDRDQNVDFTQGSFNGDLGDEVSFSLTTDGYEDDLYLRFGNDAEIGFEQILQINDLSDVEEDEEVEITYNTYQNVTNPDAWEVTNSDASVSIDQNASIDTQLVAHGYEMSLADNNNWSASGTTEFSLAYMQINDRTSFSDGALQPATAPSNAVADSADLEDATITEANTIAKGDEIILQYEAEDVYSYVQQGDMVGNVSNASDIPGMQIKLSEDVSTPFDEDATNDWGTWENGGLDGEVLNADQENGTFTVLLTPTSGDLPTNNASETPSLDTELDLVTEIGPGNAFIEATDDEGGWGNAEEVNSTITFEERTLEWNDEADSVEASSDTTASGTTNVAPGTSISTNIRADDSRATFVERDSPTVEAGDDMNTFTASFGDLSSEDAGTAYKLNARDSQDSSNTASTSGELVEGTGNGPAETEVAFGQDGYEVEQGGSVDVTVDVTAGADGLEATDVGLMLNGEEVGTDSLEALDAEGTDTLEYTVNASDLETGDHTLEASVGDVDASTSLTVNEAGSSDDSNSDDSNSDDSNSDDSNSDDSNSDDSSGDDGSDDGSNGQPGFGISVAVLSLLGAALLALRKDE